MITWRTRDGDDEDGPPIEGNTKVQLSWIAITSVMVLGALRVRHGRASGLDERRGRWRGAFADLETGRQAAGSPGDCTAMAVHLPLSAVRRVGDERSSSCPVGQDVQFNVTSLDVIDSFWAYQLGVKADANPQVNNVGLHHHRAHGRGHRALRGAVWPVARRDVRLRPGGSVAAFQAWAHRDRGRDGEDHQDPPARTRLSTTRTRSTGLAKFYYEAGLPGAGGGFYGNQYYPNEP